MTLLERQILEGAVRAQREYEEISGGWWLWHGPESFFHISIARAIASSGHAVYIDTSIKKLKSELERGPGRPAANSRQRPDISVWLKSSDRLRAVIEIKRSWSVGPIRRDAQKIQKYLAQKQAPRAGYIVVYSEAKGDQREDKLIQRFRDWAGKIKWKLCGFETSTSGDPEWAWGIALLRAR